MLQVFIQVIMIFFIASETGMALGRFFHLHFLNPVKTIFLGLFFVAMIGRIWHFFSHSIPISL